MRNNIGISNGTVLGKKRVDLKYKLITLNRPDLANSENNYKKMLMIIISA